MIVNVLKKENLHKYLIPILYTFIWLFGIKLCDSSIDLHLDKLGLPINEGLTQGACFIYMAFLAECIVALLDYAFVNHDKCFTVNFIYWLIFFISDILITIILVLRAISEPDAIPKLSIFFIGLMGGIKFLSCFLINNNDLFVKAIIKGDYTSSL